MIRVVCDTMIWYNLSKGQLQLPDSKKFKLVCTYLTLTELAFTPNLFIRLKEVQNSIKTILESNVEFELRWPYDYAKELISNKKVEYKRDEDIVFTFLSGILHSHTNSLINEEHLNDILLRRRRNKVDWINFLNELNEPIKNISWVFKKHKLHDSDAKLFRQWFVFKINQLTEKEYKIDDINWTYFEFIEKMYLKYHRKLQISKMKADLNDNLDLDNMIYVKPGDLYWTLEKRWLNIAKEACMEKYLFSHTM